MFSIILLALFIPVCLLLILIVLLQAGKGGGLAGAFGGAGAQTFLGARGAADFLSKLTIYLAIAFMCLALILSFTYGRRQRVSDPGGSQTQTQQTQTDTSAGETGTQEEAATEAGQPEAAPADEGGNTPLSEEQQ